MILCPKCGFELPPNLSVCIRCGHSIKRQSQSRHQRDDLREERVIDPSDVHIGRARPRGHSSVFGSMFGGVFGGLFDGLFGDVFGFGGFDGFGEQQYHDPNDPTDRGFVLDDFGTPIPIDVFNSDFVEIDPANMTIVDDDEVQHQ